MKNFMLLFALLGFPLTATAGIESGSCSDGTCFAEIELVVKNAIKDKCHFSDLDLRDDNDYMVGFLMNGKQNLSVGDFNKMINFAETYVDCESDVVWGVLVDIKMGGL